MLRRSCAPLAASRTRSSSSCRYLSNSPTTSRGLSRLPSADSFSTQPAIIRIRLRSFSITASMPGRSTLTATSRCTPVRSSTSAKCTCAIEALATGTRSNRMKISSTGRLNARSIVATATCGSNGGTRSCRRASSSARSAGSRSRRVDSTCPNFTKIGPSASSASRSRSPRGARRLRPTASTRAITRSQGWRKLLSTSSSSPYRSAIQTMKAPRKNCVMRWPGGGSSGCPDCGQRDGRRQPAHARAHRRSGGQGLPRYPSVHGRPAS